VIDRFSENCRRVLVAAEREARFLGHGQIATEHVLLGLLRVEASCASRALRMMGVTYGKTRRRVTSLVDAGPGRSEGPLAFTPRVREILEDAYTGSVWLPRVAQTDVQGPVLEQPLAPRLRQPRREVRGEELLFALLAHGEGVAARILGDFGVDLDKLAVAIQRARFPEAARFVFPPQR
jgi:ATP-dependent Clp protease ATP-binding subunit ClpC